MLKQQERLDLLAPLAMHEGVVQAKPIWAHALSLLAWCACNAPSTPNGDYDYPGLVRTEPARADTSPFFSDCAHDLDERGLQNPPWLLVTGKRWGEMHDSHWDDIEADATLCFPDLAVEIGVEIQGASSRSLPKKNYKLKFNRGMELSGELFSTDAPIDKLVLKAMATDRTLVREALAFELWRQMGHDAPDVDFVNLQLDDRHHGLYATLEPVDRDYLRRRGVDDRGQLYQAVRKHGDKADFRPQMELEAAFEDKTHPEQPDYGPLEELVAVIQDKSIDDERFLETFDALLSLEGYIDRMVWVSFTQNGDAIAQNFFLYYKPSAEGRPWSLIPWDSNLCFGADWRDPEGLISPESGFQLAGGNLLAERLLSIEEIRERFRQRYSELLQTVFSADALSATFEPLAARVASDLRLDQSRWDYSTDPDTALDALRLFLAERPALAEEALEAWPALGN